MKNRLIIISLLLLSMPVFSQKNPRDYIANDLRNLTTDNLKGKVKSTRSIVYDKTGKVFGLEIKKYVQCQFLSLGKHQQYQFQMI